MSTPQQSATSHVSPEGETYASDQHAVIHHTDVLVLGGGPAGTWAALAAARSGACVILADKGYCGTSGATAPSNTGAWYLPQAAQREAEADRRFDKSTGLADKRWLLRTMEEAVRGLDDLAADGYPFPLDDDGKPYRANLRGPDYMYNMRRRVRVAGVQILDHHPALELLWADGAVAGAAGNELRSGKRWEVHAGAVVVATGGCTFLSRALGCDGNTGDGYLMAAEAGARFSGMEFSAQYGVAAEHATITKGLTFTFASFFLEDGTPLPNGENAGGGDRATRIAKAMIAGHRIYALMDKGVPEEHQWLIRGQPNCFLPFDRIGLDPFKQRFPVTLRSEGTVRGTGGLDIVGDDCATTVPGLYAAGDAASREILVGAISGGGSPNASWAIASGNWSGRGAASFAAQLGPRLHTRTVRALGGTGLRPVKRAAGEGFTRELIQAVQAETLPLEVNYFRHARRIAQSRSELDAVWAAARDHLGAANGDARLGVRAREAASMLATARLIWASADARSESRGLHRRSDLPALDEAQTHRIHVQGVDTPVATPEPSAAPRTEKVIA